MLEIKREHTDMQVNGRKLVSELLEKDSELKAIQSDYERAMSENHEYRQKF